MKRLPLFPVPVVLLPSDALPLHIFERRYRRLVAHCVDAEAPFGIVYHDPDVHGPFLLEEGRIGTEGHIEVFRPLADGRSLILVRGGPRFRIREGIESPEPYYEAVVAPFPDRAPGAREDLPERRRRSIQLFRSALDVMGAGGEEVPELDPDAELSFRIASCIRIDPPWLQALLELRDEAARLERLDPIFRAAVEQRRGGGRSHEPGGEP